MSWLKRAKVLCLVAILAVACSMHHDSDSDLADVVAKSTGKPTPVAQLDLNRYSGTWYEIASYPQWFQKGCHCTRAQYELNADSTVRVLNTCNRDSVGGKYSEAEGTARVVRAARDDGSFSRLKVYFFLPWLRLFGGDYWVIGLADDYSWAVVGDPSRKYLWILSRTPDLAVEAREQVMTVIANQGYTTEPLQWTVQNGCDYPE